MQSRVGVSWAGLALWLASCVAAGAGCDSPAGSPGGAADDRVAGWSSYGGDPGGSRHSPLTEIRPDNVRHLEIAWTVHTGDWPGARPDVPKTAFQATPILDEGTLYFCTPLRRVFAVDAESGVEQWIFDSHSEFPDRWGHTCRGVALWRAPAVERESGATCTRRVFMGTADGGLFAVDAATGLACSDFGRDGRVDLLAGLGVVVAGEVKMTSPPTVVEDVVITGAMVADNRRANPPGGVIRAFDVRTGTLRWAFDPVPPGTPPLPASPDGSPRFHRGTPNAWSILSVDEERGWVFVPFGNPSPDFYGGHRDGFDYYGGSVVALDATTGRVIWRFQTVHHDLWDYDVASQPVLIDLEVDGQSVPVVAQATKMGHVFLLNRETGEPIHPVEERPVPQTDVPGELSSPTQPFPTFPEPLHDHRLDPEDAWGLTPWDLAACREKLETIRNEGIFTPPSLGGSILFPGSAGGINWGSLSFDRDRGLLVMAQNRIAQTTKLIPRDAAPESWKVETPRGISRQEGTPYYVQSEVLLSPLGVPCTPPPWGTLLAVDLRTGKKRWEVPFGTLRDLSPIPLPIEFGLPHMGGPISTASGLVFIGAAMDDYIRAYDSATGAELWRHRLPAGAQATPMTYRLRPDGRQFVVIAAGGHATLRTRLGDSLIAFALSDGARP